MKMDKQIVTLLLASFVFGTLFGGISGYLTYQPTIKGLESNLTNTNGELSKAYSNLNATKLDLSRAKSSLDEANSEVKTLTQEVNVLNQQLTDLRKTLGAGNSTVEELNNLLADRMQELARTRVELNQTREQLQNTLQRNVTITASGNGLVNDNGVDVITNRTLSAEIHWSQTRGWTGTGHYQVSSTQNNTSTGLYVGYVYILEVFNLSNVTVTGNAVSAVGPVIHTDRSSATLDQPVIIEAHRALGAEDNVSITWPSLEDSATVTLRGKVEINLGSK